MTPQERKAYYATEHRKRIAAETGTQRARRLKKTREARRRRLASETPDQRAKRLRKNRQRERRHRHQMSAAETELRLGKKRANYRKILAYQRRYYAKMGAALAAEEPSR